MNTRRRFLKSKSFQNYIDATYSITSTGYNNIINSGFKISQVIKMEVDNIEKTISTSYNFTTTGTHKVRFYFNHLNSLISMFQDITTLTAVNLNNVSTEYVTSLTAMFMNCPKLTSVDFSNCDLTNVTTMINTFNSDSKLTTVKFGIKSPKYLTDIRNVFNYCTVITEIDMRYFDLSNVTAWGYTFSNCTALKKIYFNTQVGSSLSTSTNFLTNSSATGAIIYYNSSKMSSNQFPTIPSNWSKVAYNYN